MKICKEDQTLLLPPGDDAREFFTLFPYWWNFLYALTPPFGERSSWFTEGRYPLEGRNAWKAYNDPDVLLGVRFGEKTRYFLLDIDRGSPYHPLISLSSYKALLHTLEDEGFTRPIVVSSSESEGLHIYFVLPEEVLTNSLSMAISLLLRDKGFVPKDGALEAFPAPKAFGTSYKGHRLPLQQGSFVLDPFTFEAVHKSLPWFLQEGKLAGENQDWNRISSLLSRVRPTRAGKGVSSFSTEGGAFRAHLLECMREGWTDYHQTNHLLWKISMYGRIFLSLEWDSLTRYTVETAKNSPGYDRFCRHKNDIFGRARDWTRFSMKHYYPYGTDRAERDSLSFRRDYRFTLLGIEIPESSLSPQEKTQDEAVKRIRYVVGLMRTMGLCPRR